MMALQTDFPKLAYDLVHYPMLKDQALQSLFIRLHGLAQDEPVVPFYGEPQHTAAKLAAHLLYEARLMLHQLQIQISGLSTPVHQHAGLDEYHLNIVLKWLGRKIEISSVVRHSSEYGVDEINTAVKINGTAVAELIEQDHTMMAEQPFLAMMSHWIQDAFTPGEHDFADPDLPERSQLKQIIAQALFVFV